jgi:hypothetical protein
MAGVTVSPFKEVWLELAAEWTKLEREAREVEAKQRVIGEPRAMRG